MTEPATATVAADQKVSPLELFFDLVLVLAITQVTAYMAYHPDWAGIGRGMLLLAIVWWGWAGYAWLTNSLDSDSGLVRLALLSAMGALFVVSLAIPDAFGAHAVLFAGAYLAVRVVHVVLYWLGARGDDVLLAAVTRLAAGFLIPPIALLMSSGLDEPLRSWVWLGIILLDLLGPVIAGVDGWNVYVEHFVERHALIIIIALGESIVALGITASGNLDRDAVIAALAGVACIATLWWAYFDVAIIVAERKLHEATDLARARMARDSYSYLHLPMVAGIVLLALGLKKASGHLHDPLALVPSFALYGGPAVFLLGHAAFRLRNTRTVAWRRVGLALGLLAAGFSVGRDLDALTSVLLVTCALVGNITYEAIRFRDLRRQIRAR